MKQFFICLAGISILAFHTSCSKKSEFGGKVTNLLTGEAITGINIGLYNYNNSIWTSTDPLDLTQYSLISESSTNNQGYYLFEEKWNDNQNQRYLFLHKSPTYDSSLLEWSYYFDLKNDKTYSSEIEWSKDLNNIELIPAGQFKLHISNAQKNDSLLVKVEDTEVALYDLFTEDYQFQLVPHKTYTFNFFKIQEGKEVFIESQDLYIKSSYSTESTAQNEILNSYSIEVSLESL